MKGVAPEIMKKFYSSQSADYRGELNKISTISLNTMLSS